MAASPLVKLEGLAHAVRLDATDEVALASGRYGRDMGEMCARYWRDLGGLDATDAVALALVGRGDKRFHLVTSLSPLHLPYTPRISPLYLALVERGDQLLHLVTELERDSPVLRQLGRDRGRGYRGRGRGG